MILVEREGQFEQLSNLLEQATGGRGRIAALTGEAGAGKTALVQSFVGRVGASARVYRGACEDLSIPDPLGPLYDLARDARRILPRAADDRQGQRLPLFSEALEAFESGSPPTLLVIEDLHWADDATLDFVRFLGRRILGTHILLVLTARNDGSEAQKRTRRALSDIPADNVVRIEVPLLTEAAVSKLANGLGLDGGAIYRATAGNAFFVTELLRAGGTLQPPPSVRDAVLVRAERLSVGARAALDAVSVFPRRADAAALQALCGPGSADHIAECVSNGMLEDVGEAYAFRHEIARRAIEAMLPMQHRRKLNGGALAALRALGGVATARLVHHALEAGDLEAVREFAPVAAQEASGVGAHREAAGHYQTALKQAEGFAVEERAALYERYAFECHLISRMKEAIEAQGQARRLYQIHQDRLKEGNCLRWFSRFSYLFGDRAAADAYGRQAVELLETMPPGRELAMAYSNLAQLAVLADRSAEAVRHGEAAIALAERLERPDIVCHALNNIGCAEYWLDPDIGRRRFDRSLAIALEHNLQDHAARAYTNRSCIEINLLDYGRAEFFLRSGIDYCLERDLDTWLYYLRGWLAELLVRQGRWDEAEAAALSVVTDERASPLVRYPAVAALAALRQRRGDPSVDELIAELSRFLEKGMELQRLSPFAVLLAERAWLGLGDVDAALALIDRAERMTSTRAVVDRLMLWRHVLAPDAPIGDTTGMAEPYRLLFGGDWQGAAARWEDLGAPFERGLALLDGDLSAQRAAVEVFEELGAGPAAQKARAILRRNGIASVARGPNRTTRMNHAGLTRREMEVLRLIGRGYSNKRIAGHLYISPKTVDHHVSAVLGKLEANSRGEASAIGREVGLI